MRLDVGTQAFARQLPGHAGQVGLEDLGGQEQCGGLQIVQARHGSQTVGQVSKQPVWRSKARATWRTGTDASGLASKYEGGRERCHGPFDEFGKVVRPGRVVPSQGSVVGEHLHQGQTAVR